MVLENVWYAIESHADDRKAQREEQDELNLSTNRHRAADDERNRENDE